MPSGISPELTKAVALYAADGVTALVTADVAENESGAVSNVLAVGSMVYDTPSGHYFRQQSGRSVDGSDGTHAGWSVNAGLNPSSSVDRFRTLAASGFGLGVGLQSGAWDSQYCSSSPRGTGIFSFLPNVLDHGVVGRTYLLNSTLDQSIELWFGGTSVGRGMALNGGGDHFHYFATITIPPGGGITITADGAWSYSGTPMAVAGTLAPLRGRHDYLPALLNCPVAPSTGAIEMLYIRQSA